MYYLKVPIKVPKKSDWGYLFKRNPEKFSI